MAAGGSMRLFVALAPPPRALEHLAAALAPVKALAGESVRWTTAEQWHLTLAFLGEVDERHRQRLEERLSRAASRSSALELALTGAGVFGSRRHPRVLWTRVAGDVVDLRRLAEAVDAAARRSGIPVEDRAFSPHLTLARCRGQVEAGELLDRLSAYSGPTWTADFLLLVRSRLGHGKGGRAEYKTVGQWPLGG